MNIWIIFLIALAPGIFWLWYFYEKDIYEPEPLSLLIKMFFLGVVAAILAYILEYFLLLSLSGILLTALAVPIVEESLKFLMVGHFVYKDKEFDEPMDGVIYATATALGFASLENFLYVLHQPSTSQILITGTIRAILSVPGHAVFGIFWGYALGIAKFRPAGQRRTIIGEGLVLGIVIHGLFNLLLEGSYVGYAILILIILPCAWWFAEKRIRAALASNIREGD